jgi:hypothetical protein
MNQENNEVVQAQPVEQPQVEVPQVSQEQSAPQTPQEQPAEPDYSKYIGTPETNDTFSYDKMNFNRRVEAGEISLEEPSEQPTQPTQEPQVQNDIQTFTPTQQMSPTQQKLSAITRAVPIQEIESKITEAIEREIPLPKKPEPADYEKTDDGAYKFIEDLSTYSNRLDKAKEERELAHKEFNGMLWAEVYNKYPALKDAPTLDQLIRNIYEGARVNGQAVTPISIADDYIAQQAQIRNQGRVAANQTKQVVRSFPTPSSSSARTGSGTTMSKKAVEQELAEAGSDAERIAEILARR